MTITFRCDPALIDVLPPPIPAGEGLPDWLRTMPAKAYSALHERAIRTVKQCPPFVDAMRHGFLIRLPCDVRVDAGRFSWDWDRPPLTVENHPQSPLSFHAPAQLEGTPWFAPDAVIVKFNSFWTIALDPGWSLFATHPVNRADLPFRLLTGLVDADRFYDAGINFPAQWIAPDFNGVLAKGTPVAQCFAVPRAAQQMKIEAMSAERAAGYGDTVARVLAAPGVYRKRYREGPVAGAAELSPGAASLPATAPDGADR
jgi:hypothetical protein